MKGLAQDTAKIIEAVSKLQSIKPYILVGGTALSLQLDHRLSEDLDFMRWAGRKGEKMEVDWPTIEKELKTIGNVEKTDVLGFDHVEFYVDGVKFSFYASTKQSPVQTVIQYLNNIVLADMPSISSTKMEVLLRRSTFRDYYDLYCIMQDKTPEEIKTMIDNALKYSEHKLSSKNLYSILITGERFKVDEGFAKLEPKYNVTPSQIEVFMKSTIKKINQINEITM